MKLTINRIHGKPRHPTFGANSGFTLIELVIAVAILAIIVAVAIPSYRQWVLQSQRAEAKTLLLQSAQALERCFTRYGAYDNANCPLQAGETPFSENEKYQLTVATTATTFDLTATPQDGQAADTECANFTLDETGARGVSAGTTAEVIAECWGG